MAKIKEWRIGAVNPDAEKIAQTQNCPPYLVQLLLNRGIKPDDFVLFLEPSLDKLLDPFTLKDMDLAVRRIEQAIAAQEKVFVVGDYDVDGITSLTIFSEFSQKYPDQFIFYVPHRVEEGYGLSQEIVEQATKNQAKLIIAFDCGTNAFAEVAAAAAAGIDLIVVDHHHPRPDFKAYAFINPKRVDANYPYPELSAAVLAFKLLQALTKKNCFEVLDLVALSIVCDVVPLKGENRILLNEGLIALRNSPRPAIKALCQVSKLKQANIDVFHVGFILGPRINACSRVAHGLSALELFRFKDYDQAYALAEQLQGYNQQRKNIESEILKQADSLAEQSFNQGDYALVVSGQAWHPGVLGIVASRLADKYYRPAFVISFEKDQGKGSARSIHSVHLMEALSQCQQHLSEYGGHKKAAGLNININQLAAFKARINQFVRETVSKKDLLPQLVIDFMLQFSEIDLALVSALEKLKPFGEENPKPLFMAKNVRRQGDVQRAGIAYAFWFTDGSKVFEGLVYDKELCELLNYAETFDIAFQLERNSYHNVPKLIIKDIRLSG